MSVDDVCLCHRWRAAAGSGPVRRCHQSQSSSAAARGPPSCARAASVARTMASRVSRSSTASRSVLASRGQPSPGVRCRSSARPSSTRSAASSAPGAANCIRSLLASTSRRRVRRLPRRYSRVRNRWPAANSQVLRQWAEGASGRSRSMICPSAAAVSARAARNSCRLLISKPMLPVPTEIASPGQGGPVLAPPSAQTMNRRRARVGRAESAQHRQRCSRLAGQRRASGLSWHGRHPPTPPILCPLPLLTGPKTPPDGRSHPVSGAPADRLPDL
jgi:hypothetical protein